MKPAATIVRTSAYRQLPGYGLVNVKCSLRLHACASCPKASCPKASCPALHALRFTPAQTEDQGEGIHHGVQDPSGKRRTGCQEKCTGARSQPRLPCALTAAHRSSRTRLLSASSCRCYAPRPSCGPVWRLLTASGPTNCTWCYRAEVRMPISGRRWLITHNKPVTGFP